MKDVPFTPTSFLTFLPTSLLTSTNLKSQQPTTDNTTAQLIQSTNQTLVLLTMMYGTGSIIGLKATQRRR